MLTVQLAADRYDTQKVWQHPCSCRSSSHITSSPCMAAVKGRFNMHRVPSLRSLHRLGPGVHDNLAVLRPGHLHPHIMLQSGDHHCAAGVEGGSICHLAVPLHLVAQVLMHIS